VLLYKKYNIKKWTEDIWNHR